jgi:signal peptidase II
MARRSADFAMTKTAFVMIVTGSVLGADQITKWYIQKSVALHDSIPIIDSFFHITHVRNSGGAFSLLANADSAIRIPFFVVASIIAIGALVYLLRQVAAHQRVLQFALAGVLGGALGNAVDRILLGQVTDFLDFHWRGYYWPAFNVADSFITIGVLILLLHSFFAEPPAEPQGSESSPTRPVR